MHAGTLTSSDHRLVIARMNIDWFNLYKTVKQSACNQPINSTRLVNDPEIRSLYQSNLSVKLSEINDISWSEISKAIMYTAEDIIGRRPVHKFKTKHSDELENLSKLQKDIKLQISNSDDEVLIRYLKHKRTELMHKIRRTVKKIPEDELDKRVREINKIRDDSQMFKAVNTLKRKKYENPYIHDENRRNVSNPQQMYTIINTHFKNHFYDENAEIIEPFVGESKKLNKEFDADQIRTTLNKTNNNRSDDYEDMATELVKYGPENLPELIANVFNATFEKHQPLATGVGVLVSLPKPNKVKGPVTHLRPIIFLPIIRKIFSKATIPS